MQHMVSLVQLGVLRSVRAVGELHCNSPPARTLLKTPSCTKDTIFCICKGNYKFYCSWRWAYRPETCRAKINKYLHQVGNWLLSQTPNSLTIILFLITTHNVLYLPESLPALMCKSVCIGSGSASAVLLLQLCKLQKNTKTVQDYCRILGVISAYSMTLYYHGINVFCVTAITEHFCH